MPENNPECPPSHPDPIAFTWFGMATYASYGVGQGLNDLATALNYLPGLTIMGENSKTLFAILGTGNREIFLDVAWVALAYKKGGMKELELHKNAIDSTAYQGWVALDKATQEKDISKKIKFAQVATQKIAQNEQEVLQKILDKADVGTVRRMTLLFQAKPPPFPGGSFALDDFSKLENRVKQIVDVVMPSFMLYA